MSRKKAKEVLSLEESIKDTEGVYISGSRKKILDESPKAYKDFKKVLDIQVEAGIIAPDYRVVKPLLNIKA